MKLVSDTQAAALQSCILNLFDTVSKTITIVKETQLQPINVNQPYMAGYGPVANPNNYVNQPESKDFQGTLVEKLPDGRLQYVSQQQAPTDTIFLKTQQDARDYIQDGRKNLHAIIQGVRYNIVSDGEVVYFLNQIFYIFKLEMIR